MWETFKPDVAASVTFPAAALTSGCEIPVFLVWLPSWPVPPSSILVWKNWNRFQKVYEVVLTLTEVPCNFIIHVFNWVYVYLSNRNGFFFSVYMIV